MKIGNLSYKMGFLVTKWESWLQNKIFAYQKGFLAFKWESRFAIHRVNINQIAKKYNEHNYVEPSEELLCKLDEVYGMMKHTIRIMKGDRNVAHY